MKCPKCGLENEFGAEICTNCKEVLKNNAISNNGFSSVDLDVLQPLAVEQSKVERPVQQVEEPTIEKIEEPVIVPLPSGEAPPAIGQILDGVAKEETTKTPVFENVEIEQTQNVVQQEVPKPVEQVQNEQILEPMHKQEPVINWRDKGLLAILGCGILCFAVIGTLIIMSVSSVNKETDKEGEVQYKEIQGEWIDSSKNNLIVISKNSYTWYQDFSNDKSKLASGEVKVFEGKKALSYLNISKSTADQLLNTVDETDIKEFYALKLFTPAKEYKNAYYKMLFYVKEDGIIVYNFNDKKLYFLYKNN